jgi:steroid delta-isomerase-like uncharacterized protein
MATTTTSTEAVRDVTERWMRGWNEQDADALVELIAADLHYTDPARPEVIRDAAGVRAFTAAMWRAMPDMRFTEPLGVIAAPDGALAAAPWHMTGTFTGPLEPPGYAPTDDRLELDGVDVFELRDGKIARLVTHYDAMDVARKLGILPPRGSRAERAGARLQGLMAKARRRRRS